MSEEPEQKKRVQEQERRLHRQSSANGLMGGEKDHYVEGKCGGIKRDRHDRRGVRYYLMSVKRYQSNQPARQIPAVTQKYRMICKRRWVLRSER